MITGVLMLSAMAVLVAARPDHPPPSYHAPDPYHPAPAPYHPAPTYEQVPAKYDFGYDSVDPYSGAPYGHEEVRDGYLTKGSYYVPLPDGRVQKVSYYVDGDSGFIPEITYEGEADPSYNPAPAYKPAPPAPAYG